MAQSWILGVITLAGLFQCGLAIMCYECNSATNFQCSVANLPDSLKRNCSEHDRGDIKHTLCRKITQHVDVQINGDSVPSRVVRGCGWDESKYTTSCYHRSGFGSRHEVCSCTKDFCNSSNHITSTAIVVLSSVLYVFTKIVIQN